MTHGAHVRGSDIAIVGGSIAGCAAALAAHRGGAGRITVYERAAGDLADRGVGVAVHNTRYAELESAGHMDAAMPWVQLTRRRWYVRDGAAPLGRTLADMPFPFRTYNWGPLWRELRGRVPDPVDFRTDTAVARVVPGDDCVTVHPTPDGDDDGVRHDLVIGADGYRSAVRTAAWPGLRPHYCGYLAWRGAFPTERLTAIAPPGPGGPGAGPWEEDTCAYVVFPGGHLIVYRIPDGRGGQRANWVLYTTAPAGLDLPLDTPTSLPPGTLADALHGRLRQVAEDLLPPYWGALVGLTAPEELFVQPLYDFTAPQYVRGRLLLLGDAATVARPHTGAGAVKALQDATTLESALASDALLDDALRAYDRDRTEAGRALVGLGRRLGGALVQETPDWRAMDQDGLEAWWRSLDGVGVFGGRRLGT